MFPVVCDGGKRQAAADTQKAVKRRWRTVAASGGHAKSRKTQVADTTPFGVYNINNTEGWGEALCTQHCMAGETLYGVALAGEADIFR